MGSADCGGGHRFDSDFQLTVEVQSSTFRSWAVVEGDEGGRIVFVKKGKLMTGQLWRGDEGVLVEGAHSQQVVIGI